MRKLLIAVLLLAPMARAQCPASPTTPNMGLALPNQHSPNWGFCVNGNSSLIDSKVIINTPASLQTITQPDVSHPLTVNFLFLGGDPTQNLQAATKQYVDAHGAVPSVFGRTGAVVATSGDYSFSLIGGTLGSTQFPALTGDITTPGASLATTLATVNSNVGSCGDATHVSQVVLDAKGRATSCTAVPITVSGVGTVTSFSAGTLSPLFTTSVANATSTPALSFTLSNAAANTVFGNFTSGSAAPTFTAAPTFSAANLTNFPTFNQNTTGTASNLSGTPALPNGTTATTQTVGDNTTKLATTAFVIANAASGTIGGSGTIGFVPKFVTNTTTLTNSTIDDGITTANTVTVAATAGLAVTGANGSGTLSEGTCPSGVASSDILCADATSHRLNMNNNNGTQVPIVGSSGTLVSGNIPKFNSSGNVTDGGLFGGGTNILSGDATITSTSLITTGLALPTVPTSTGSLMHFGWCHVFWHQTTPATVTFGFKASNAPTSLRTIAEVLNTTYTAPLLTGITTTTATNITASITPGNGGSLGLDLYFDLITPGSSTIDLTLYALTSNGSDALTVEGSSACGWYL